MAGFDRNALMKSLKTAKETEKSGALVDQRIWKPEVPEKGKAIYKIRVLPNKTNTVPWAKVFQHNFKTPAGSYVNEVCPVTLGKECPICSYAAGFFNTGDEADRKKASNLWRKHNFYANILVVKDPRNDGANEGKVFLYRFGKKIYEKFDSALFPPEGSEESPLFFMDPVDGFDFSLICKTVGTGKDAFPNYDESSFVRDSSPISKNPKDVDKILDDVYDIEVEFLSPKRFKSYEELENILNTKILGVAAKIKTEEENSKPEKETQKEKKVPNKIEKVEEKVAEKKVENSSSDDDFMKSLEKELEF